MKQILLLFLLFPCFAMAQYTGNANQKITLGEQTTADGLVYRGVENDTALITPLSDTSAYIILDTVNNKFYNYNRTTNVWSLAGGGVSVSSFSAGTTGLTPNTATTGAVTLGGTLAASNGGTGLTSLGTGVATFLGTPTSANLAAAVTNETGSGALVFATSPTLVTPALGTPSSGVLTSATGLPLTTGVTGVLPVANGGTGATSISPNNYLIRTNNSNVFDTSAVYEGNGNIGVSTIPNNWISNLKAINIAHPSGPFLSGNPVANGSFVFGLNAVISGEGGDNRFRRVDAFASNQYIMSRGNHTFSYVKAGTAGTPFDQINVMRIDSNSRVGIMTLTPSEALHVVGNARITAVGAGAYANDLNITSTGVLTTASSDEKYKYNILPINYGLSTILQLKPVNFQWLKGEENDLGFIAQDVAEIIPEAVDTNWNSDLLMRYESIIPILTKAIQEQNALIKALEQRILTLENK